MTTKEVLVIAPRHERMLEFLKGKAPKKVTSREVSDGTGISYQTVARELKRLWHFKYVNRHLDGKGHQFRYTIRETQRAVDRKELYTRPATFEDFQEALFVMASTDTILKPQVVQQLWKFPFVTRELFRLALSVGVGEIVNDQQLKDLREKIAELREAALLFASKMSMLYDCDLAWKSDSFAAYLLDSQDLSTIESAIEKLNTILLDSQS